MLATRSVGGAADQRSLASRGGHLPAVAGHRSGCRRRRRGRRMGAAGRRPLVPGRSLVDGRWGAATSARRRRGDARAGLPQLVLLAQAQPERQLHARVPAEVRARNQAAGLHLPARVRQGRTQRLRRHAATTASWPRRWAATPSAAELVGSTVPPFVLASVSGGDGYWHPRPGDDPLGMVLTEFPQILAQHGLPVDRFGLLGWSMGGYGALLAATEDPTRFPAVVANSPGVWPSYDEARDANPTAFTRRRSGAAGGDLRPRVRAAALPSTVRIDCGESDSVRAGRGRPARNPARPGRRAHLARAATTTGSGGRWRRPSWPHRNHAHPAAKTTSRDSSAARVRTWNICSKGKGVADYTTADRCAKPNCTRTAPRIEFATAPDGASTDGHRTSGNCDVYRNESPAACPSRLA